jgi:preprotein translocase subunit SecF
MRRVIDFLRLRYVFMVFSAVLIAIGIAGYFVLGGFNLGVDFTAGLVEQVHVDPVARVTSIGELREAMGPLGRFNVQVVGRPEDQEYTIKVLAPGEDAAFQSSTESQIEQLLTQRYGAGSFEVQSSDFVGPRYSRELASQTVTILLVALILILIYAAVRFQFIYGMAAVLCLVHDALFMLSVAALFRLEFTTTTVAAILTIIGYSINDTIVIFDRVRENRSLMRDADLAVILNTSITQTLSRTILTSTTTLVAIIALAVIGSGDIKNFAVIMLVGIVEGTYSTVFIASPIVLEWTRAVEKRRRGRDLRLYGHMPQAPTQAGQPEAAPVPAASPQAGTPVAGGPSAALPPTGRAGDSGAAEPREVVPAPHGPVSYTRVQQSRRKKKRKH